jgi:uncharacterized protein (TIGR00730 family)
MSSPLSICVYCGSSNAAKPHHLDLAGRLGAALAARGVRLVYGGGRVGLMGRCAEAAHKAGGEVLGVMPHFLARREITYEDVPHRMVETMHERKHIMFEESQAFIVLPGGIGTLEEAVEMLSWRRLELHAKPLVFLSEDGFWDPFFAMMQHTIEANFTPAHFADELLSAHTIEDALATIEARVGD